MSNKQSTTLNQLIDIRLEKLKKIKNLGYNPYPHNFKKIHDIRKDFTNLGKEDDYENLLKTLATAKKEVSEFFDNVIVNDSDENIKKNRLELLQMLCKTFDNYFNFSRVESTK